MAYFLGIDVSTTATKALIIDGDGTVVAVASTEYPFETPKPLWSEQDPKLWWDGAVSSIKAVLKESRLKGEDIGAIGLTGQMHGLVLLDENGQVLRPSILWNDQRTAAECDQIRRRVGVDELISITGNDALTGFTAPKLLWVRNNEPEVYAKIHHILLPKDYLRLRLTGVYATDKAGAAGTLFLNVRRRKWSERILRRLDIPHSWLPPTHEGPEITGVVTVEAAGQTGLSEGTPVVGGGGDQSAQAVGVGAVTKGIVALTLGTSGVVFASVDEPFVDPRGRLHAFCHAVPGRWHLMGVMLSAAGSLRWYRDTLAPGMDYSKLLEPASSVPPGSDGLLFLPYLTGERTPYPDPTARGAFVGLTVRHRREHMTRAVLEGVAFGLRDSFELMRETGLEYIDQVRVSGGGARSELWRSVLANVLGTELVTVNTTEGAAFGAAILAGVGAGHWESVEEATDATVRITGTSAVDDGTAQIYERYYREYRQLYPALKDSFAGIAAAAQD